MQYQKPKFLISISLYKYKYKEKLVNEFGTILYIDWQNTIVIHVIKKENGIIWKILSIMFLRVETSARLLINRKINSFSSTCNAWLRDRSTKHSPDYRYLSDRLLSSSSGLYEIVCSNLEC